jgi:hypothetical protein
MSIHSLFIIQGDRKRNATSKSISTNFQKKKEDDFDIFHYHFSSGMNVYGLEKREEDSTV